MDVFISEEYVRRRRVEKKATPKVASTKASQTDSHSSHWNGNDKAMSFPRSDLDAFLPSNTQPPSFVADHVHMPLFFLVTDGYSRLDST
ncbi:hypothetical protein CR513_56756, partial [Mucuna pruriens]